MIKLQFIQLIRLILIQTVGNITKAHVKQMIHKSRVKGQAGAERERVE